MNTTGTDKDKALPLIGAQLSSAGGFLPVPQRALDIGAEVVQIFNTNPRVWRPRIPTAGEIEAFAGILRQYDLPLFFHSSYLINLASPDEILRRRSAEALAFALATGALAGAEAVVTHVGSHRGEVEEAERRVVWSLSEAVHRAEEALAADRPQSGVAAGCEPASAGDPASHSDIRLPALLLENGSGGGHTIGGRLEDLAAVLSLEESSGLARELALGICIDTAHLFAAGYPVHEKEGLEALIDRLRSLGLLERIRLVHLNDSKTPFGVRRDQHENPGEGVIGYEALAQVVRHPALVRIPFVLETPGDGHGPTARNIAMAKSMRAEVSRLEGPDPTNRCSDR